MAIANSDEILIERMKNINISLPSYEANSLLNTEWHDYSGEQFGNLTLWSDHYILGEAFKCIA